jgi:hypothetical protein
MVSCEDRLFRLLYTSHQAESSCDQTGHSPVQEAATIAELSAVRNARVGITGSLLIVEGQFIQILEGPYKSVEETFERICRDFRHHTVKLIDLVEVNERVFPEWSMAGIAGDAETRIRLNDEIEELRFLVSINADEAVRQMRTLLDAQMNESAVPSAM